MLVSCAARWRGGGAPPLAALGPRSRPAGAGRSVGSRPSGAPLSLPRADGAWGPAFAPLRPTAARPPRPRGSRVRALRVKGLCPAPAPSVRGGVTNVTFHVKHIHKTLVFSNFQRLHL